MRRLLALLVALSLVPADPLYAARPGEAIHNWENMPVHTRGGTPSPSQVREAIIAAGMQVTTVGGSNWEMVEGEPGRLVGTLRWGREGHVAQVTITYSPERYSVLYRDSANLGYDPDGPNIHPNYNKLVRALVFKIQSTLNAVDGDPTRVIPSRATQANAATRSEKSETIAVSISAGPGAGRSRNWSVVVAEWRNHMPDAVDSVGADLLTVKEDLPAALGRPGTLVSVRVNSFRYVSPARPYTRPPVMQGSPTNASMDVTVQYFDLMTGNPLGIERAYRASAVDADYAQSTNLQVRSMARAIMADWRASPPTARERAAGADRAEVAFWESVRNSREPAELLAYLKQFPEGAFVALARKRLSELGYRETTQQP